jgi:hypothetical protein
MRDGYGPEIGTHPCGGGLICTNALPPQLKLGYQQLADELFEIGTEARALPLRFGYKGTEYVIWAWKGEYLGWGDGTEVGLYAKTEPQVDSLLGYNSVAPGPDLPKMSMNLNVDGFDLGLYAPIEARAKGAVALKYVWLSITTASCGDCRGAHDAWRRCAHRMLGPYPKSQPTVPSTKAAGTYFLSTTLRMTRAGVWNKTSTFGSTVAPADADAIVSYARLVGHRKSGVVTGSIVALALALSGCSAIFPSHPPHIKAASRAQLLRLRRLL